AGPAPARLTSPIPARPSRREQTCLYASWFPPFYGLAIASSNVALLRGFFVARIEKRVGDDRYQEDDALDEVLAGIGHVEDRHAVEHGADQQRADNDVDDAAAPAR